MFENTINFIKQLYPVQDFIALHEPVFHGNEKKYLNECVNSTFVSSIGKYVDQFEEMIADYVGCKYAIATSNGTAALHIALLLAGVDQDDEVITQPLTFVATCNAISYCGAMPIFVDVDKETLGLSPKALKNFLEKNTYQKDGKCINKTTHKIIKACVPMHTFGHPCRIDEVANICKEHHITLIEDSAESLGSRYKNKHTGTFGMFGTFSFNGNKIITSGGGGCIVTDDEALAKKAKHLTTTAKVSHKWEYVHDEIGYNYRMPNLNAALLVAQFEQLDKFVENKRELASLYANFFAKEGIEYIKEPQGAFSNYWLNGIILKDKEQRDRFLEATNSANVMTRPIWKLMNRLKMFQDAQHDDLENALWLEERVVNIPSGVRA